MVFIAFLTSCVIHISCRTLTHPVNAEPNVVYLTAPVVQKQDTVKQQQQPYNTVLLNTILNRLPKSLDRLDGISDKVDQNAIRMEDFIKSQAVKDSQFNIMFNVANARRRQIAAMKIDSAEKESKVLAAIKKMADAAENDRKYKAKAIIEEKVDTNILLFCCISTLAIGVLSNIGSLASFVTGIFKKKSYV